MVPQSPKVFFMLLSQSKHFHGKQNKIKAYLDEIIQEKTSSHAHS